MKNFEHAAEVLTALMEERDLTARSFHVRRR